MKVSGCGLTAHENKDFIGMKFRAGYFLQGPHLAKKVYPATGNTLDSSFRDRNVLKDAKMLCAL